MSSSPWSITIGFNTADKAAIAKYTGAHNDAHTGTSTLPADYLAVLADGYVLSAPSIEAAVTGGTIQIAVTGGQTEANGVFKTLTGH